MGIKDFFKELFHSKQKNISRNGSLSDFDHPPKQAIRMIKTTEPHISKFGGKPYLPDAVEWPKTPEGYEMDFVGQIHLPEVPEGFGLPAAGTLFIFYDDAVQPSGFEQEDYNYWKIIYTAESLPEIPEERTSWQEDPFAGTEFHSIYYKECFLAFEIFSSRASDAERFSEQQEQHQMFGYPLYIQDEDMAPGYELLLQIDSDESVNGPQFMWMDCGRLFFWIKPEDLTAGRFDNLKLVSEFY